MKKEFRFIHTADLHQGIDFSEQKWKKNIPQRSDDFLKNFELIIKRSLEPDIDFVIFAGDIYNRSKPNLIIKKIITKKLFNLSDKKPVFVVPGNHDKSRINMGLLFINSKFKIFNSAGTVLLNIHGFFVSISGIPFIRDNKREKISNFLEKTNTDPVEKVFKILILHELVESCKVGMQNFEFTKNLKGVLPLKMLDKKFDYVALGHVHKHQKIESKSLMYYSGSIERTSVVERDEEKGFLLVIVECQSRKPGFSTKVNFIPLPSRKILYFKILRLNEIECNNLQFSIMSQIKTIERKAIIVITVKEFDNYRLYTEIRFFLNNLKKNNDIFDFRLTFTYITQNKSDISNLDQNQTTLNLKKVKYTNQTI
jgi:exonuclease SbcD